MDGRIGSASSGIPVWPDWTLADCETQLEEVKTRWETFLASAALERLESVLSCTNSRGGKRTPASSPTWSFISFSMVATIGDKLPAQRVPPAKFRSIRTSFMLHGWGCWNIRETENNTQYAQVAGINTVYCRQRPGCRSSTKETMCRINYVL